MEHEVSVFHRQTRFGLNIVCYVIDIEIFILKKTTQKKKKQI